MDFKQPANKKPSPTSTEPVTPTPAPTVGGSATSQSPTPKKKTSTKKVVLIVALAVAIFIIIPAILFIVGAAWVGNKVANEGAETFVESTVPGYDVDVDGNNVSLRDGQGNEFSAGSQSSVPEGFPSNVPLYSNDIIASGRTTVDGKTGWTVTVQTGDSLNDVANGLRSSFSQNGWTIEMESTSNDGGFVTALNGGLRASAFYSTADGKSSILYTVTQE